MANLINLLKAYDGKRNDVSGVRREMEHLHRKFFGYMTNAAKGFLNECEFRPVESAAEFQNAARVVNEEIRRGAAEERELKARWFSLSQATDRSITFICLYQKTKILGTLTMVLDSTMGLPSDHHYKNHMGNFRSMGREMAEITALVLNNEILEKGGFSRGDRLVVALKLMKAAIEYSLHTNDVDTIVIRCNRRHEMIHKALFYRPLTGLEYYTGKEKELFPAFFLDVDVMRQQSHLSGSRLWNINFNKKAGLAAKPFRFTFSQLLQTFSLVKTTA